MIFQSAPQPGYYIGRVSRFINREYDGAWRGYGTGSPGRQKP